MKAIEMIEIQIVRDAARKEQESPSSSPTQREMPSEPAETTKPWRAVTEDDVSQAIAGTLLGRMSDLLAEVTEPKLPLPITLPKALALCGCALTQQREASVIEEATAPWGISRSRFRIDTAGGQACNIWSLIVAPSGTGKDIGNMPESIARSHQLSLGSSGSAEGLADVLKQRGAGLLTIGEFGSFLDKNSWQSKAAFFLTDAWSRGWFQVNLSQRSSDIRRESPYCYPSIVANIQPHTLRTFYNEIQLGSGFLARFLLSYCGSMALLRPRPGGLAGPPAAEQIFNCFLRVTGHVEPPSNYLGEVVTEFNDHGARYPHIFGRLVNEYGPRFAVMLAVDSSGEEPVLTEDVWRKAAILVRWFYAQAERIFDDLSGTEYERRRETRLESFLDFIRRKSPCTLTQIAHQYSKNTNKEERKEILDELLDRGRIAISNENGKQVIRAVA